jgi:hypothetical protein
MIYLTSQRMLGGGWRSITAAHPVAQSAAAPEPLSSPMLVEHMEDYIVAPLGNRRRLSDRHGCALAIDLAEISKACV